MTAVNQMGKASSSATLIIKAGKFFTFVTIDRTDLWRCIVLFHTFDSLKLETSS